MNEIKSIILDSVLNKQDSPSKTTSIKPKGTVEVSKLDSDEYEEKNKVFSSLSSIGIIVKEIPKNNNNGQKCNSLIEARKILTDLKNQFTNGVLENEQDLSKDPNGLIPTLFPSKISSLVTNHLFYSAGGEGGSLVAAEEKEQEIIKSLSAKIEYLDGFEADGDSMRPIWKVLDQDVPGGSDSLFCRIRQESGVKKLSNSNSFLNTAIANEFFTVSRTSLSNRTQTINPNIAQSFGKVQTPLMAAIDENNKMNELSFLEIDDDVKTKKLKVHKQIVKAINSIGYDKEVENDYVSKIFGHSMTILQPIAVISFGTDFGSLNFKNPKIITTPIERTEIGSKGITNRSVTGTAVSAGIQSSTRISKNTIAAAAIAENKINSSIVGPSFTISKNSDFSFIPQDVSNNPLLNVYSTIATQEKQTLATPMTRSREITQITPIVRSAPIKMNGNY